MFHKAVPSSLSRVMTSDKLGLSLNVLYSDDKYLRKSVSTVVALMIESSSESELIGGITGGSTASPVSVSFLVSSLDSSLVSPLYPLSIKVRRGSGDNPVIRVGLLLLVFAETGVVSSADIQANNGGFS